MTVKEKLRGYFTRLGEGTKVKISTTELAKIFTGKNQGNVYKGIKQLINEGVISIYQKGEGRIPNVYIVHGEKQMTVIDNSVNNQLTINNPIINICEVANQKLYEFTNFFIEITNLLSEQAIKQQQWQEENGEVIARLDRLQRENTELKDRLSAIQNMLGGVSLG